MTNTNAKNECDNTMNECDNTMNECDNTMNECDNKHYKKYKQLLNDAFSLQTKSELLLSQAAKELALSVGFSEEQSKSFSAIFATGGETIVTYNEIGNMSDLDLNVMETMTKQQIIEKLYKYEKD